MVLWWRFGIHLSDLMADELASEIQMPLGDMNNMSKPPTEHGSWNAFARIHDIKGQSLFCSLRDTALVPYDFKLDFEDPSSAAHASFTWQTGGVFGGYDLQVTQLDPVRVQASDDTILWNIPKLDRGDGWNLAHLFASGFSGWSQAADFIGHNHVPINSQVAVELDTRIAYAGHELYATCLGPDFLPPPGGHFGICGTVHDKTILRAMSAIYTLSPPCPAWSKGGKSTDPLDSLLQMDGTSSRSHTCVLASPLLASLNAQMMSTSASTSSISNMLCSLRPTRWSIRKMWQSMSSPTISGLGGLEFGSGMI